MKVDALNLISYGPFTGRRLDFARPFTIAYGRNEAGKSSALRALLDGLYGIPGQTSDSFLHPYGSLRIGIELSSAAGPLRFVRRKGRVQTLRSGDDSTVVEDSVLDRALRGITRETFASMFGISHEALVAGGRALAEGQGEIGQLLFVSAAGLAGMQTTLLQLEEQAAGFYAARASSKSIHRCLRELRDAEQQLKEKQVVLARFQENQRALDETGAALAALDAQVESARRESDRLTRIRGALPTISERRQAELDLAATAAVAALPGDYGDRLNDIEAHLRVARKDESTYGDDLASVAAAIAALRVSQDLIAADEPVRALYERKSAVQKSKQDCARRTAELAEVRRVTLDQVQKLRPGMRLEEAAGLEPGLLARHRIQELAPGAVRIEADRDALARAVQDARRKLADCDAAIASLPTLPDTTLLAAAVERARRELDLRRARDLRAKLAAAESSVALTLRSLAPWTGSADDLAALPVPDADTVEEFRQSLQAAADGERAARAKSVEAVQQIADAHADRERIVALDAVPTLGDLAAARELRASGWSAVKRIWKAGDPSEEQAYLARTGQSDLAAAFEGAMAGADRVADRIREDAQRVEQVAALDLEIARLARRKEDAAEAVAAALATAESARERWLRAWLGCGIVPESPSAMLTWLRRRASLVEQAGRVRELRFELATLDDAEAALASDLQRLLAVHSAAGGSSAADLLAAAEAVLTAAAKWQERRQSLLVTREAQRFEIARMERETGEVAGRLNDWRVEWGAALESAGLPQPLTPAAAELYLNSVRDVVAGLTKAKDLEHRIAAMQSDSGEFAAGVAALVARLNPNAAGLEPEAAIGQLHQALMEAHQNRKLLDQQRARQREIEAKLAAAAQSAARCAADVDALCREAAAPDLAAARESWAISRRRRELEQHIAEYDERLRLVSAGKTVAEFLAEAASVDADSISGRLDELRAQIASLREQRAGLEDRRRALDAEAVAMRGGDTAAAAAQQVSGLVGRLAADVEQYVRLRTATFVIRKAIERYRDRNQGPVLERAARLFAALTCGSFGGLRVDNHEGAATLVGIRASGEIVPLTGMSDGTLDQLYLALRIASLEHYFAEHEPAPFIVDDVLLNFDDERAAAALSVLDSLSEKTQVIFFTHHRRLVELAASHTKAAVCEM